MWPCLALCIYYIICHVYNTISDILRQQFMELALYQRSQPNASTENIKRKKKK